MNASPESENFDHTIDFFVEMVRKSGLIEIERPEELLGEFRGLGSRPFGETLTSLTTFLISQQALTAWQVTKLRERKYKGFALGRFVLLDQLSGNATSRRYLARDQKGQELVAIRVYPLPKGEPFESLRYDVEEI
jgi:serine/threonine-protein kinase